jgi:hypothetical protein
MDLYEHFIKTVSFYSLKVQCHEIFDTRFFSSNNPPKGPDSGAKAVSHMALYRRVNQFENRQNWTPL